MWYDELDTNNIGTIKRKKFFYFLAEKKLLFSPDVSKVDEFLKSLLFRWGPNDGTFIDPHKNKTYKIIYNKNFYDNYILQVP